ncbi:MAG: hypothetical protein IH820_06775 [Bacteroidetes bacterium]|nr:hypothetical protein [Bacteroidota bacterium]
MRFRDFWQTGYSVEIGVGRSVAPGLDILLGAHYGQLTLDTDALLSEAGVNAVISGGDATLWGAHLAARQRFGGSIGTFVMAGAGYARFSIDDIGIGLGVFHRSFF